MEFLQNPDVVYLLLAGGLVFAVLALLAPGTGFLEIGVFAILGLAGWGVVQYNIPINWLAFIILLIGIVLFLLAIRKPKMWVLLVASIAAVVLGSAFIFRGDVWYIPAVNPFLATILYVPDDYFHLPDVKTQYLKRIEMIRLCCRLWRKGLVYLLNLPVKFQSDSA